MIESSREIIDRARLVAQVVSLQAELAEAMGECISFTISYGIGQEERYRARYRELTGHGYHDEEYTDNE